MYTRANFANPIYHLWLKIIAFRGKLGHILLVALLTLKLGLRDSLDLRDAVCYWAHYFKDEMVSFVDDAIYNEVEEDEDEAEEAEDTSERQVDIFTTIS